MPKPIQIEINDVTLKGTVTDSDAMFFASLYHNEAELALAERGQEEAAFYRLSDRFAEETKTRQEAQKISYDEATTQLSTEMGMKIRRQIEHDWKIRQNVTWRIREIFPTIPSEMVFWHSDTSFGIRLDMKDLVAIFLSVFANIFEDYINKNSSPENATTVIPKKQSLDTAAKVITSDVISNPDTDTSLQPITLQIPDQQAKIDQLQAEIDSLKASSSTSLANTVQ